MEYKAKILEAIDTLCEKGTPEAKKDFATVRKQVEETQDERTLCLMWQSFREVLASEAGQEATFKFKLPDGKIIEAKSMEEARQKITEHGYKSSEEAILSGTRKTAGTSGRLTRT